MAEGRDRAPRQRGRAAARPRGAARAPPGALSGGQRQRVAMGRAIVREPQAFLMDEPLSNLDAKLRVGMRAELARLHDRLGVTTVYVTHDQVEAMTLGQRVAVMRDGYLQQVDTPQNLYRNPVEPLRRRLHRLAVDEPRRGDDRRRPRRVRRLPDPAARRRAPEGTMILGIRPQDFEDARLRRCVAADDRGRGDRGRGARLRVARPLRDRRAAGRRRVGARRERRGRAGDADRRRPPLPLHGRGQRVVAARGGERLRLAVDSSRFHFFDRETGENLAARALATA